jgi:hypothetical protein
MFESNKTNIFEYGKRFALCTNCNNVTVLEFVKCHKCETEIDTDKSNYSQLSKTDKYFVMVDALMKLEVTEDPMIDGVIVIYVKGKISQKDISYDQWHIKRENNVYKFVHYDRTTNDPPNEKEIDPLKFFPLLDSKYEYELALMYDTNVIFVHQ